MAYRATLHIADKIKFFLQKLGPSIIFQTLRPNCFTIYVAVLVNDRHFYKRFRK